MTPRSILLSFLLFVGTGLSANTVEAPPVPEQTTQAREFLLPRLKIWQQRLQLEDWTITLLQVKSSDLKPGTLGNIRWNDSDKTATIRVLLPSEYKLSYVAAIEDMECTLVHELIHLELASLPKSEASRSQEEHAVNRMAEALLKLDRSGGGGIQTAQR